MSLVLKFQNSGALPGAQDAVSMTGGVLTIGRGEDNDLCLPDPERTLSKRHCVLEERGGEHVLIDLSTNGTFLNYGPDRLSEIPTPLNHGDVIQLGSFELVVEIASDHAATTPMEPAPQPAPIAAIYPTGGPSAAPDMPGEIEDAGDDFLDVLLGGATDTPITTASRPPATVPDHSPVVQDHFAAPPANGAQIPDDWDDLLYGGAPVAEGPAAEVGPIDRPSTPSQAEPNQTATVAANAFLSAAGAGHLNIPEAELPETMARLGRVFAAMVTGMRDILLTRAALKSEMRVDRTMINPAGNNPLKFSISPEQAVEAMIRPTVPGYQDADTATAEALRDIKAHEVAVMAGMEAALKDLLGRLGPDQLSARIEHGSSLGGILQGKKARYWEAYEQQYAEIARETEDNFQSTFGREFARAYQNQLERLKP